MTFFAKLSALCMSILITSCSCIGWGRIGSFDNKKSFDSVIKIAIQSESLNRSVSGTAWAIDENHVVSAAHVCQAFLITSAMADDEKYLVEYLDENYALRKITPSNFFIEYVDLVNDVCIITYKNHGLTPLSIADGVSFGEKVFVVGAPAGMLGFVFEGFVVNVKIDLSKGFEEKIVISAASTGGNSGGPVFNEEGKVMGILIAGLSSGFDHFSICTSMEKLKIGLKLLNIKY